MPPGALVPRDWLLAELADRSTEASRSTGPAPRSLVDVTIRDLAQLFGKRASTVRAWVERGDFPGAYKLHGREWRVPVSAIEAFKDQQRNGARSASRVQSHARLSAWRSVEREHARRAETGPEPATGRSPRGNAEA